MPLDYTLMKGFTDPLADAIESALEHTVGKPHADAEAHARAVMNTGFMQDWIVANAPRPVETGDAQSPRDPVTVQVHVRVPLDRDEARRVLDVLPDDAVLKIETPPSLLPAVIAPSVVIARWEETR